MDTERVASLKSQIEEIDEQIARLKPLRKEQRHRFEASIAILRLRNKRDDLVRDLVSILATLPNVPVCGPTNIQ